MRIALSKRITHLFASISALNPWWNLLVHVAYPVLIFWDLTLLISQSTAISCASKWKRLELTCKIYQFLSYLCTEKFGVHKKCCFWMRLTCQWKFELFLYSYFSKNNSNTLFDRSNPNSFEVKIHWHPWGLL